MWFPCMHHILELVLKAVIQSRWPSQGPTDSIYKRFQEKWPTIVMKDVEKLAKAKVSLLSPDHPNNVTTDLHQRLLDLLSALQPAKWQNEVEEVFEAEPTGKEKIYLTIHYT